MLPAKQLEGVDMELALARAKVKSIVANDPNNYTVLFDALSVIGRLGATKNSLGKHTSRQFSRALKIVLENLVSVGNKPARSKPHNNDGAVSPSFPENG